MSILKKISKAGKIVGVLLGATVLLACVLVVGYVYGTGWMMYMGAIALMGGLSHLKHRFSNKPNNKEESADEPLITKEGQVKNGFKKKHKRKNVYSPLYKSKNKKINSNSEKQIEPTKNPAVRIYKG